LKLQDQAAFHNCRARDYAAGRQDVRHEIGHPPLTIIAGAGRKGLSSRGQDISLAGDGENMGIVAESSGLHIAHRAPD
jgi:hypothetical protein